VQISELSRRAGIPLATVKFYLREGLLPPGQLTGATRARYGEEHLARLRLVRALLGPGGLSVATARRILAAVDEPTGTVHDALGAAHRALPRPDPGAASDVTEARRHLRRWGWHTAPDTPALQTLADALEALRDAGMPPGDELLDRYARAALDIGEQDVADVPPVPLAEAVRFVVINTVLLEPVLVALRRLAQEHASGIRFRRKAR
jgi:DNA-binding transcriptional MerR regulator